MISGGILGQFLIVNNLNIASSAATCNTIQDQQQGSVSDLSVWQFGDNSDATMFTAGTLGALANYSVCKIEAILAISGSPTGNITASIYSNQVSASVNVPNVALGTTSPIAMSTLPANNSFATMSWKTNSNIALTSGSIYWMYLQSDGGTDNSNYVIWRCGQFVGVNQTMHFSQGTHWSEVTQNRADFTLYSSP